MKMTLLRTFDEDGMHMTSVKFYTVRGVTADTTSTATAAGTGLKFHLHTSVLFCSSAVLDPRVGQPMDVLSPLISVLCHSDSSTESPAHVLMLSIQAVRGLPRLRAPGIVPCIISFSSQLPHGVTIVC